MTGGEAGHLDRAIAGTVAGLLAAATAADAPPHAWDAARDAAQMLGLDGLDRALAACAQAPVPPAADVTALADRLARTAAAVAEAGDLAVLRAADPELHALAGELVLPEAARAIGAGAIALPVREVLEDVALADDASREVAARSLLPVPVAAALRAAIDWLAPPGGTVRLAGEPSLLEVRLDRARMDRLYAAHRVLAAAGGNLGPAADGAGGWSIRVPSFAERPSYLMLVLEELRIAVPWHAVLRLRLAPAARGAWPLEYPPLAFDAAPADAEGRPAVLVGHGLKRAYLVADRLIWRMTAEPCENEWGSPRDGWRDTVLTEDGEVFWVADPARLLGDVELPEVAHDDAALPALTEHEVEPLATPPASPPAPSATVTPAPIVPLPVAPRDTAPAPPAAASGRARALVADDSLAARLLLARLLEHQGFEVTTAASSAELHGLLAGAEWTVLLTDLELPDGGGPEWLRGVIDAAAARPHPVHVVALVRDGGDLDVARAAGVDDTLIKPFAREALTALLARHDWTTR